MFPTILIFSLFTLTMTGAQGSEATVSPVEQKYMDFLLGSWEGDGWQYTESGKEEFESYECVYPKLGSAIYAIEGKHYSRDGKLVHNAFAIVSPNPKSKGYKFKSYLSDGRTGEYDAQIEGQELVWTLNRGLSTMRFTINVKNDTWSEIGEFSSDKGVTWKPFFQMQLTRTKKSCRGF